MQQQIVISPANKNDIPVLVRLINSAYRGDYSRKGWTTEADFLEGIRIDEEELNLLLSNENAVILKAVDHNKIVGSVYLEKQGDVLYLGMLTVDPILQAKGIGKLLLKAAEKHASDFGCGSIRMNVITLRDELIRWYEKHGYEVTEERKPFPTGTRFGDPLKPLEFLIMRKAISSANFKEV